MELRHISEPLLEFGVGQSVCPKDGIANHFPYDIDQVRPNQIKLGIIGKEESVEKIIEWLNLTKSHVEAKTSGRPKPKLFPEFPGFNNSQSFKSEIIYDDSYFYFTKIRKEVLKLVNQLYFSILEV